VERCSAALTGNSVERSDRLTKPRATDIASAAEIISRIGVLFMKGAQRELVDVNELLQEMIVLPRTQAALPLQTAAPRRLTQFFLWNCRSIHIHSDQSLDWDCEDPQGGCCTRTIDL